MKGKVIKQETGIYVCFEQKIVRKMKVENATVSTFLKIQDGQEVDFEIVNHNNNSKTAQILNV
jgi:cold shock CspA family protein